MTFDVDAQGLGSVLAAVPQYIIVVDRDGIIRYVNRVQEGFDLRAIIGTHSTAVIAPESVASREAALRLVFANGTVEEYEVDVSTCGSSFPSVRGATGSGPARTRGRRVQAYLEETTGSRVTHGFCPDCLEAQMKAADNVNGDAA